MIVICLDERGVRRVAFEPEEDSGGPLDDASMWVWPKVQGELFRLDDVVKKEAARLTAKLTGRLQAKGSNKV